MTRTCISIALFALLLVFACTGWGYWLYDRQKFASRNEVLDFGIAMYELGARAGSKVTVDKVLDDIPQLVLLDDDLPDKISQHVTVPIRVLLKEGKK